jgi:hypothetical protein
MALESIVTYFRIRLGVNDKTENHRSGQNARHTVQIISGCFQVDNLTCAQLCHPIVF